MQLRNHTLQLLFPQRVIPIQLITAFFSPSSLVWGTKQPSNATIATHSRSVRPHSCYTRQHQRRPPNSSQRQLLFTKEGPLVLASSCTPCCFLYFFFSYLFSFLGTFWHPFCWWSCICMFFNPIDPCGLLLNINKFILSI